MCPERTPAGLARPEGFEPPTSGLEIRCSILLSYGRRDTEAEVTAKQADNKERRARRKWLRSIRCRRVAGIR